MTSPRNESKSELRRVLRANRPGIEAQISQSGEIRSHLRDWLASHPARVIAAFSSIPGEAMLLPLIADFPDRQWVLPRIEGEALIFHFVTAEELPGIASGSFGIGEPAANSPVCPTEQINLFLCPGMAFTKCGKRLGRGKGFYDRALSAADSESERVGVCFREQVIPELPIEVHDLPMHFLATPDGVTPTNQAALPP
ncbi:5-formyltetrahydrofolate cyclo-ligase [Luteolibacter luteus]|uniref:5-formyltetrahydrofolate cyclo-ligase n=1 Tax=Luteolibacter luteus TaxID=2728835 RepID=UPI0023F72A35|nr:5-formyltetrahydrofolate cyclo-ligase [Luteolibacter luteus]